MKWKKLEYGKWPEGMIVLMQNIIPPTYKIGCINRNSINNEWYFYCDTPPVSIDSIYDLDLHYIALNEIEML